MASILFGLTACTPPEPVRLGFIGGMSGRVADLGIDGRNGAMLAVEMRNKAGGIKGRQIQLTIEDDQQNPEVARKAVSKLIDGKVEAIIGPMTSSMAMATVPIANQAQTVLISPTVTTNELSGLDDYFFRLVSATRYYAGKNAEHHLKRTQIRRVAVIYDLRNKAYTESWLEDYRNAFIAGGGSIAGTLSFSSSDDTHFSDLARQLLQSRPDGILVLANSVDAALLCQHVRKLNPAIQISTSEWAATERLIELGGRAVEGLVIAQFIDREGKQPGYVEFRRNFNARFGKDPGFAALTAFDAANVIIEAIEHQAAGQSLKQTLTTRRTFSGAQNPVVFDNAGDTQRETYMTTIKDGAFVLLR